MHKEKKPRMTIRGFFVAKQERATCLFAYNEKEKSDENTKTIELLGNRGIKFSIIL